MNTIFHIAAMLALGWMSVYSFSTLDQPVLGYASLGLFIGWIPVLIDGAKKDFLGGEEE